MFEESTIFLILIAFAIGFMFFGTVGNVISLIVLCRKATKLLDIREYLIVLIVFDLGVLYSGLLPEIMAAYDVTSGNISDKQCKLTLFFEYYFLEGSSWMTVIIAFERMTFVLFPFLSRSSRYCRATTLVILVCMLIVVNAPMCLLWKLNDGVCDGPSVLKNSYFIKYSIFPSAILILSNTTIAYKLCRQPAVRRTSTPNLEPVFIGVAVSVLFLVTTFPASIVLNVTQQPGTLLSLFVSLLLYTNNSFNFVLYMFASKVFREELTSMIKCKQERPSSVDRPMIDADTRI